MTVFTNSGLNCTLSIIERDGKQLFVAKDVAEYLEYKETANMRKMLDDDEYLTLQELPLSSILDDCNIFSELHPRSLFITESGLYHAIFKSTKDDAKRFRRWITEEVLPAIRKTGSYSVNQKIELLEKEKNELKQERDDAIALLKKSTHNRISTYCKNEDTGEMELTSKDRLLVDLQQKWAGQYILHATALSQTIHMMKALNIPLPTNFLLKDGREFFATYTEPCCEEKPTKASDIAKVIRGNGQDLFDFMR